MPSGFHNSWLTWWNSQSETEMYTISDPMKFWLASSTSSHTRASGTLTWLAQYILSAVYGCGRWWARHGGSILPLPMTSFSQWAVTTRLWSFNAWTRKTVCALWSCQTVMAVAEWGSEFSPGGRRHWPESPPAHGWHDLSTKGPRCLHVPLLPACERANIHVQTNFSLSITWPITGPIMCTADATDVTPTHTRGMEKLNAHYFFTKQKDDEIGFCG